VCERERERERQQTDRQRKRERGRRRGREAEGQSDGGAEEVDTSLHIQKRMYSNLQFFHSVEKAPLTHVCANLLYSNLI
jgi:hypothetical protein